MGTSYNPRIVTENLVFCVDAANVRSYPKTGTTWTDLKGGNNGTLNNMDASNFSGNNAGGLTFDGTNEYCSFSSIPNGYQAGMTNYSMSIWFKLHSNGEGAFIEIGNTNTNLQRIMFWLTAGSPRLYALGASSGGTGGYRYSSVYLDLNRVYNAVYTYDNSGPLSRFYIDGVEDTGLTNSTTSGLLSALSGNFHICADAVYTQSYTPHATMFNVSLYTKTLTADEIRQNYLATKERYA